MGATEQGLFVVALRFVCLRPSTVSFLVLDVVLDRFGAVKYDFVGVILMQSRQE